MLLRFLWELLFFLRTMKSMKKLWLLLALRCQDTLDLWMQRQPTPHSPKSSSSIYVHVSPWSQSKDMRLRFVATGKSLLKPLQRLKITMSWLLIWTVALRLMDSLGVWTTSTVMKSTKTLLLTPKVALVLGFMESTTKVSGEKVLFLKLSKKWHLVRPVRNRAWSWSTLSHTLWTLK